MKPHIGAKYGETIRYIAPGNRRSRLKLKLKMNRLFTVEQSTRLVVAKLELANVEARIIQCT